MDFIIFECDAINITQREGFVHDCLNDFHFEGELFHKSDECREAYLQAAEYVSSQWTYVLKPDKSPVSYTKPEKKPKLNKLDKIAENLAWREAAQIAANIRKLDQEQRSQQIKEENQIFLAFRQLFNNAETEALKIQQISDATPRSYVDIPLIDIEDHAIICSEIETGNVLFRQKEMLIKYEFIRDFVIHKDCPENIIASVFDATRTDNALRQLLVNKKNEINVIQNVTYDAASEQTILIRRICRSLGLNSTHDFYAIMPLTIFQDAFIPLQADALKLSHLMKMRDTSHSKKVKNIYVQRPEILLAKLISRIFKNFCGIGLETIVTSVSINRQKVRLYYYRLNGCEETMMANILKLMT